MTRRRWHEGTLPSSPACRRRSTPSSSSSCRSGPRCSAPSSATSERCWITSPVCRSRNWCARPPGSPGSRPRPAAIASRGATPRASRTRRRRCCESAGCSRRGGRRSTSCSRCSTRRSTPGSTRRMPHVGSSFNSTAATSRSSPTSCGAASRAPASASPSTWPPLRHPTRSGGPCLALSRRCQWRCWTRLRVRGRRLPLDRWIIESHERAARAVRRSERQPA